MDSALLVGVIWTVLSLYGALRHAHGFCTARLYYLTLELFMFGALSLIPIVLFSFAFYLLFKPLLRRLGDEYMAAVAAAVAFLPVCVVEFIPKNIFVKSPNLNPIVFWSVLGACGLGLIVYLLDRPRLRRLFNLVVVPAIAALVAGFPFGMRSTHELYWLKKTGFSLARAVSAGLYLAAFPLLFAVFFAWFLFKKRAAASVAWAFVALSLVFTLTLPALYTGPPVKCEDRGSDGRPNFLFIVVDALRADAIEPYGGTVPTPNMTALARTSVVFEDTQSVSPWTLSSMASFFTGLYPSAHGVGKSKMELAPEFDTVYRRLRRAGYSTWAVVDQHFYASYRGISKGFDVYHQVKCHPCKVVADHPLVARTFPKEWTRVFPTCRHPTVRTALDAEAAVERSCEPFFGWVHFYDPHMAYAPPSEFTDLIPDIDEKMRWGHKGKIRVTEVPSRSAIAKGEIFFDAKLVERTRDLYLAEVRFVDRELARIFDALERSGLWDRTVVILTADHGEEIFDHGFFEHGHSVYDEVLRVPLIIHMPGSNPQRVPVRVRTIDVVPTMLDLAGVKFEAADFHGRSLLPLVRGQDEPDREVLAESLLYYYEKKALLVGRYKLIWWPFADEYALYDLESDPHERYPLAGEGEVLQNMKARLSELLSDNARLYEKITGKSPKEVYAPLTDEQIDTLKALGYIE